MHKISMLGAGLIGRFYTISLQKLPGCEVSMICSSTEDEAQAFAEEFGIPRWSSSSELTSRLTQGMITERTKKSSLGEHVTIFRLNLLIYAKGLNDSKMSSQWNSERSGWMNRASSTSSVAGYKKLLHELINNIDSL